MKNMNWKVIKTEHDYDLASDRLDELISVELTEGSHEHDEYELLCLLIEDYESKHYKFDKPDPIDYIKFIMDQKNLSQKDMVPYFGSASKASEVLNGKRNLSKQMIQRLHAGLGIPLDILIDINKIYSNEESLTELLNTQKSVPIHIKLSQILPKIFSKTDAEIKPMTINEKSKYNKSYGAAYAIK